MPVFGLNECLLCVEQYCVLKQAAYISLINYHASVNHVLAIAQQSSVIWMAQESVRWCQEPTESAEMWKIHLTP